MKMNHFMGLLVNLAVRTLCLDMVECCSGSSVLSALLLYVGNSFTFIKAKCSIFILPV